MKRETVYKILVLENPKRKIELLSPAANAEVAFAAIDAGADAVYIGGPAFGARAKAGNNMADIGKVAAYAHRYGARCFLTLNTLVYESEMAEALQVARQAYEAGVDALIIQDMGLLEAGLPPMELHASTQCHIASPEKARFLEKAGFRRLVLARELSIREIDRIASSVQCEIECFVHGALCVSYSGQCYMGCHMNGRSGNRGECSQACRLSYDLADAQGRMLQKGRYLLSMKDLNAEEHVADLLQAGVSCLKIEGRLKDAAYVKNVTAYYRRKIDKVLQGMPGLEPLSQGHVHAGFEPDLQKGFHRPYTTFNLSGKREKWVVPSTPKAVGEEVGQVSSAKASLPGYGGLCLQARLKPGVRLLPGDGLCYLDREGVLQGSVLERVAGKSCGDEVSLFLSWSGKEGNLPEGKAMLYRNRNQAFEKELQDSSCERKIGLRIVFDADASCFRMEDEYGFEATLPVDVSSLSEARQEDTAKAGFLRQLSKLGGTAYSLLSFSYHGSPVYFMPSSLLNDYRRKLVSCMDRCREMAFDSRISGKNVPGTIGQGQEEDTGDGLRPESLFPLYRWNVANSWAARFYQRRGLPLDVSAFELQKESGQLQGKRLLMVCKHCIRFQLGQCLKGDKGNEWYLYHGREKFVLRFDCRNCRMEVWSA